MKNKYFGTLNYIIAFKNCKNKIPRSKAGVFCEDGLEVRILPSVLLKIFT